MDVGNVERAVRVGRLVRPLDREGLRRWVGLYGGMHLPLAGVCERHGTPLDYLEHVFFEKEGEAVVWACRGGGKTMVGAVATLLDLVFKPGVEVRIIGGSREQSEKMYDYLCELVERRFGDLVLGRVTKKGFGLRNGSRVEILSQSAKAVRGTRVQKVRCDEIELFKEEVWKAVQLTTRGKPLAETRRGEKADVGIQKSEGVADGEIPRRFVRGSVEVFSTMHVPGGMMQRIVEETCAERQRTKDEMEWRGRWGGG